MAILVPKIFRMVGIYHPSRLQFCQDGHELPSYHPSLLFSCSSHRQVFFSWRTVSRQEDGTRMTLLCGTVAQDGSRMAVGCLLSVNKPDRVSVITLSCSTLSLRLDSNDCCRMLLGSKTQHVRKAYFVFVKIWITTNRMVLGWSSNLTSVMSTPRINRMALG